MDLPRKGAHRLKLGLFRPSCTRDGGYILAGYTTSGGPLESSGYVENLGFDAWLIKTDANGNELWNKTFGEAGKINSAQSVQQTTDGGYILSGLIGGGGGNTWLIKTYPSGNEEWESRFPGAFGGESVRQADDGGYIIGCLGLIKTDSLGNEEWNKFSNLMVTSNVRQTSDGGYILAGYYNFSSPTLLIKIDSSGNEEWSKPIEVITTRTSIQQTSDGGYIIAGDATDGYSCLLKTDANGNV